MPATDWKEVIAADEPQRFERFGEQLRGLQIRAAAGGTPSRTLHNKTNAGMQAEFTVRADLPVYARVGLFASPGTYRAYVRFSNGAPKPNKDTKSDVRGAAIKVVGVKGRKLIPGMENALTQDFLMIQSAKTPFRTADEFVTLTVAADNPVLMVPRMISAFGVVRTIQILRGFFGGISAPVVSLATSHYWSALPIKLGAYAVRYHLAPQPALDSSEKPGTTADYLHQELAARLRRGSVEYDFQLQFYTNEQRTPIEDGSVEWQEQDSPFITVARLTIPQQDLASARGVRIGQFIDSLSFDPWHALEEFRPLGNLMRARRYAYQLSRQERNAAPEPDGTEQF